MHISEGVLSGPVLVSGAVLAAAGYGRGEAMAAGQALPIYLRDEVAAKPS